MRLPGLIRHLLRLDQGAPERRTSGEIGDWGEAEACRLLRRKGYKVLGTKVRPNRRDELDIVAKHGKTIVFVEVKTRRSEHFGRPAMAVDKRKRQKLCRAAAAYLRRKGTPRYYYRFDVVEVIGQPGEQAPTVRHLENAFQFDIRYRFGVGKP